ncbi:MULTISPECIES: IS5 family transposase [unclassified Agrobacterium]|uniref:IS5 family transposase n=1 Tax=unclassified Agrobacterium TaxID=2632611 RepID=UPI00083DA8BC|nr:MULTISPECIES: IS5 family transposase [unclassified Agrobacterium]AOG12586.1 transposase DDE domain protein [Agrobacterium sp. RAC06]QGG93523.1 IS5 family transposase [Agrobacterium sp. MA01]
MARSDLTDMEWRIIEGLLPTERGRKSRPAHDNRQYLYGMLRVLRVGCPWRDMHERYGNWNSVNVRFRRWAEQAHARADGQGSPLGFVLTCGEVSDYNAVPELLAIPVGKLRLFLADKAYDGDFLREELLIRGIRPVIPPKANRKNPPACDYQAYKDRNRIERMLNRLKQFRRVATRYDKTRKSFAAFLALAAAKIWLPYFINTT